MTRSTNMLALQILVSATFGYAIFIANTFPVMAAAQNVNQLAGGSQAVSSSGAGDSTSYSNPNLGFSLAYPSNWEKRESLNFFSPSIGLAGAPEAITVLTEAVSTANNSLDAYTGAVMSQIESLPGFSLINSSSTTLGGSPAQQAEFTFTGPDETTTQNLQVWTVKDGLAYIITYTAVPSEFDNSMPAMQGILDTFRFQS